MKFAANFTFNEDHKAYLPDLEGTFAAPEMFSERSLGGLTTHHLVA